MSSDIAQRIRRGAAWLHINSQSHCEEYAKSYNHTKWLRHLTLYEQLVDQATKQGLSEQECLRGQTAAFMSEEEMMMMLTQPNISLAEKL